MLSMKTSMKVSMKICGRSLIVLTALGCLGAPVALAQPMPAAQPDAPTSPPSLLRASEPLSTPVPASAPAAGLRIFVDPLTGELTPWPTPQQAGALAEALAGFRFEPRLVPGDRTEGLIRFELSRGGTGIRLDKRYMTATVVHLGPDGEAHLRCAHDPEAALEAHAHSRPTTATDAPLK